MYTIFLRLCAVFLMIAMGWIARRADYLDGNATRRLAKVQTHILYPALIYSAIVGHFTFAKLCSGWVLPAGAFGIMAIGFAIGLVFQRLQRAPASAAARGFLFQCTINNYSFLPMPLAFFFWGDAGVAALMFSTLGSEVAVWTLGVYAMTGHRLSAKTLRHLLNVPLMAVAAAVGTLALQAAVQAWGPTVSVPGPLREVGESLFSALEFVGRATIPMAMIIVGSRMAELRRGHLFSPLQALIAFLRLIVIPAVAILVLCLLPIPTATRAVLVLVAVMPSANASVLLSEIYEGDVDLAAAAILVTHVFSLLTIPIWLHFFGGV